MKYLFKNIPSDWVHYTQIVSLILIAWAIWGPDVFISISGLTLLKVGFIALIVSLIWEHK